MRQIEGAIHLTVLSLGISGGRTYAGILEDQDSRAQLEQYSSVK